MIKNLETESGPSMAELLNTLHTTLRQIDAKIEKAGLLKELKWVTEHRDTPVTDPLFPKWQKRYLRLDNKLEEMDPTFSLAKYWAGLNKLQSGS